MAEVLLCSDCVQFARVRTSPVMSNIVCTDLVLPFLKFEVYCGIALYGLASLDKILQYTERVKTLACSFASYFNYIGWTASSNAIDIWINKTSLRDSLLMLCSLAIILWWHP